MLAFSFWNAIWFVIICFLFVTILMMMFEVVVDIFRDRELSGWAKAGWLLALVLFTLIALIAYVLVRGEGMANRQVQAERDARDDFDAYVRDVAGGGAASELEKAASLHTQGKITDDEYAALKARILA
jgi:hypothetical protein